MLNPSGINKKMPPDSFENLLEGVGYIQLSYLEFLIPKGTLNSWTSKSTDRIQRGFKYKFGKYQIHGHERDSAAPIGSVAKSNWIVRIKHKSRYLLSDTVTPPTGGPTNWSKNKKYANLTHIPAILNRHQGFRVSGFEGYWL